MNKKIKIISFVVLIITMISSIIFFINNGKSIKKLSKKEKIKELINISELDQDFVDDYFKDYYAMSARNNLENVLIVISEDGIHNTYGATQVVNAPNHQYFLQYENENDRKKAYKKLKSDGYLSVEENTPLEALEDNEIDSNNTSTSKYNSWGIEKMGLDYAIEESNKRENINNVVVAVIDTGLDVNLFNENYTDKIKELYNSIDGSSDVTDNSGHGTHVTGTIAEGTPDNVKIMPIKASRKNKRFEPTDVICALNYIQLNNKADVINMSLAGYQTFEEYGFYQAIESVKQKNIIVVAGSGNDGVSYDAYPAGFDNTISVGCINEQLSVVNGSNYGASLSFIAPGFKIASINGELSGTSMASPHVAAAVAVVKGFNKNLSLEDTVEVLKTTTDDLGDYGWDKYYGYGLINFENKEFCDGTVCDKYNVFKNDERIIDEVIKIETPETLVPSYNYGNITNLMNANINIYYTENDYVTKKLGELDNVEISNYDAYSYTLQNVSISYKDKESLLSVDNRSNSVSGWKYEKIDNDIIKISQFLHSDDNPIKIYIPNKIGNYDVVELGDSLFENNTFVKSVYLPNSVIKIDNNVFKDSNIEVVDIKADSISVGNYAFYGLKDLKVISTKINKVGEYAFYNCYSLDNIQLSNSLTEIGQYAFANNSRLKNISIPTTVIEIGKYAFSNTSIDEVIIPNGIEEIKEGTFYDCTNLSSLTIPNGVKRIDDKAFQYSILTSLYIPSSVEYISSTSFSDISSYTEISVDSNNAHYKSKDNTLIEKETDKLILGTIDSTSNGYYATIPDNVKIIGERAFANRKKMTIVNVDIPQGVTTIEDNAFYNLIGLSKLVIPKSVTSFAESAINNPRPDILTIWLYSDSVVKTIVDNNDISYRTIDPFNTKVNLDKTNYKALEKIDRTNLSIVNSYHEKNYGKEAYVRDETITSGYNIVYNNGDSLSGDDEFFTITAKTDTGYDLDYQVPVTVEKITPEYTIPNNLTADLGDVLSDVTLPNGFSWVNGDEVLNETGILNFKAIYTPEDTVNYKTVEDIDITVNVVNSKTIINPSVSVSDKTYDGTNNIEDSIIVSGLDSSDYTILNAQVSGTNVGNYTTTIKLKLTDEKFQNYSFEGGLQEKDYTVNIRIVEEKLTKPTLDSTNYVYNGLEQTVTLNNFDSNKMNIEGNIRTNAGTQDVIISLKNSNYKWSDGTNNNVVLNFIIEKADINVTDNSKDATYKYDGDLHSITMDITGDNTIIKYMDNDSNYSLDELPKYKDVGTYKVKYKVSIDDNYTEYYGEKTLNITNNQIVNNSSDYEGIYDGEYHSINVNIEPSNHTIKYSINNTNYDLNEIPKFKDVGEYTVNYKITMNGYNDLIGINKVKIYGVKEIDSSITKKDNVLIVDNNSFNNLSNKITTYSTSSIYNHYDNGYNELTDDNIKTGDIIRVNINNTYNYDYSIALLGDTSGDGKINYLDYVNVYNHIQKVKHPESNKKLLTGVYLLAADMSKDNKISYLDYVGIYNKIKELKGGTN